ncbi:amidohydrolase family protein [Aurantiacibacter zhengii]|uniref:Amidohydrolase n=1 Tax=Aurantiacibacter zhengii TaxID=2307003 RepID=A0A418NU35_9SPHN|nr:amidohydrolase family protein [Aurantiacibacter zhengii]RIV87521.1 amidohydrolase [Aurantiacibacter zhengii]
MSVLLALATAAVAVPIIDVHHHAIYPGMNADDSFDRVMENLDRRPVSRAVIEVKDYDQIDRWLEDERFIIGVPVGCGRNAAEPIYECFPEDEGWPDIGWLEEQIASGRVQALHEMPPFYSGWQIGNPRYDPYLALAHRYDIPVGIHIGKGPPVFAHEPGMHLNYDPAAGNPATLRPVLEKYPGLRVWLQHVGAGVGMEGIEPYTQETMALLADYPNVYVDLSVTNATHPLEVYSDELRRLFDAGFGDRVMFGTDNYFSDEIIARMDQIAWLTDDQKRAILHDNAARFLRLED